ncbi:malate dehydrogenase [Desulfotignum phosphitoxidans]|uniref:Malate dehydrogenase Mdh n=1 Tax=Desulfotignum phosphitoxidans DSM 13687 TaxID=1286635 RepID=S0FRB1_9BACT|nr:malate dehydrogenase [Desulfotignum phosphitoxidans]EMS77210.1 malate dehydrogenase Mdh [Desulfotignum phosphitoxidans DSM 13687]
MIGIIGSGNVGANTAFFLAEKGVDHVTLFDIQDGLAQGKALDMMEAAPIRGYRTVISGTNDPQDGLNADIVIITAGAVRKPGMDRDALFQANKEIIIDYAKKITRPDTRVIIVSEPVDLLTTLFARHSLLPPEQIMGLGGILDATRLRFLIADELGVSMENVAAQVVGRHSDDMIILHDYCCVSGVPVEHFLSRETIDRLFDQTRQAGGLIVELAGRASAYYGPSAVAADLAEAICHDTGRVLSVSRILSGQFGITETALSLPCVINRAGASSILEPRLDDSQIQTLKTSARTIQETLKEDTHA